MSAIVHVTNWGNSLLLMPLALAIAVGLVVDARAELAARWSLSFTIGVLFTLATKVAFLGWAIGIAALDFTGVSGHTMLASSVLPMFAWWVTEGRTTRVRRAAISVAAVLALGIAVTRVVLELHSVSEVVAGLIVGYGVAALAIAGASPREGRPMPRWFVAAVVLVAFAMPLEHSVEDRPHDLVAEIALILSGHDTVYTRDAL